jgi:hypothetical protein
MQAIKCKRIQEERKFEQGYVTEVEILEGSIPRKIGIAEKLQYNDTIFQVPIQLVETCKEERKYRFYINTSAMHESNHFLLEEQLQTQSFELNYLEHPFFENQHNYRKVLFLIDESDLFNSLAVIDLLTQTKIQIAIYVKTDRPQGEILDHIQQITHNKINYVSSFENDHVVSLLNEQLIGTRIFISGPWAMFKQIKAIANTVGFTSEEIYYNGPEESNNKVYCVKCYSYNKRQNTNQITCEHCNTILDVSRHFSKRLDAYLGYIQVK